MEKEKHKAKPKKLWNKIGILNIFVLLMICLCGASSFFFYIINHNLSYFGRFETEAEVVSFLHDNFDLYVTTSDEILTFMNQYPLELDGCLDSIPEPRDFANYVVDEEVTNIINCIVPARSTIVGNTEYLIRFYMNFDNQLVYISAYWRCACL